MSTHAGDIFIDAKLNDKQYKQGLSNLEKKSSDIGRKIGKALTVTAIATGIAKLINQTASLGDAIDKTSQKLGMSAQAYQEWDFIMRRSGASIDSMTVAMKTLASSVETGKDALAELGITTQEAMGMSQEQLFERVITALQGVEDVTHRTYLATQLLGRGSTELGAVLNLTAEDMDNLKNRVASLGGVMSDTAVKNSAQFKDALTDIKFAFRGIADSIATYVLPILTSAINNVIIPAIQAVANVIRSLLSLIGRVSGGLKAGANAVKTIVGKATQKDAKKSSTALNNVGSATKGVGGNAKKAKKQVQALKRELLGFDQITKLTKQDNATGTGGGGGTGSGGLDLGAYEDYADQTSAIATAVDYLSNIQIPPALSQALTHLKEALGGLFDVLASAGEWIFENILKPLGEWLINSALPVIINAIATAIELITNVLELLGRVLEPIWTYILKPLFSFLGDVAIFVLEGLTTVLGTLSKGVEKATEGWDKIKSNIETIKNAWVTLKEKAGDFKATATLKLSDTFTSLWNKVKGAWNGIKDKTATMKLKFTEGFKSIWNGLAKKVNAGRTKSALLKTLFPKPVPLLAQGGYVKANTPTLAMIGDNKREGEIVAPESKLRAMAQEVAGANNAQMVALLTQILNAINQKDTNVYLDGEAIKNNTVRRINNHTRATGQLELII